MLQYVIKKMQKKLKKMKKKQKRIEKIEMNLKKGLYFIYYQTRKLVIENGLESTQIIKI